MAIVVTVVAASLGALILLQHDDAPTPAASAATGLSKEGKTLVALLERGRKATYHVRYEGTSPDAPGTTVRLETWQRAPRVRQDSEVVAGGKVARTRSIVLPTGGVRCTSIAGAPWACRRAGANELRTDGFTDQIVERLQAGTVRSRFTSVDGRQVRCFTLTTTEGTTELCANDAGIPVRVRAGASMLRAVSLTSDVGDDVFEPPAIAS